MDVRCPLTGDRNVEIVGSIPAQTIIDSYQQLFEIDVSRFFNRIEKVDSYTSASGYRFFHPGNLAGDDLFYEDLMKFDWYYLPWKWEHQQTVGLVEEGMRLLEVGSGDGQFLKKLTQEVRMETTGLEINRKALDQARASGLEIVAESIEEHARAFPGHYDVVCSFQVLEHIYAVGDFLKAQISCLKSGGKLVVSVPNNGSFIQYDSLDLLNLPPHHMGQWDHHSLSNLAQIFDLKLIEIRKEPLQQYHVDWYHKLMVERIIANRIAKAVYYKTKLDRLAKWAIRNYSNSISGHTIMAVFQK